jgi:D-alanyl-D-alanine carboxypeptidase/D-alanyl-D-alanine-endopeptidase (penicillin-binding protein 4)
MKNLPLFFAIYILHFPLSAQTVTQNLQKAYKQFESDSQLKHGISSLYVINAKTGEVVFDRNSQVGLAPASTQKIIIAATAFELLGKNFQYKTEFGTRIDPEKDVCLWINPSGDPTFGSWRWESTKEQRVLNAIVNGLGRINLDVCKGVFVRVWNSEQIPDGWIWQDIGNYYGAGAAILNWRENQYDLFLKSGKEIGDPVQIVEISPKLHSLKINCWTTSAKKESGDNAYIYVPLNNSTQVVRGTIPVNEEHFKISGAILDPINEFISILEDSLRNRYKWTPTKPVQGFAGNFWGRNPTTYYTHYSPTLDSIIYWFLQKSINLYGEALIKTFAYQKLGLQSIDTVFANESTDTGVAIVKRFWKQKGLDEDELNIYDGSGLSPLNRVTTHAQVEILKYAKQQSWFPYFFNALPEYNNMKMKSGSISDVKSFCGYHTSGDGTQYIFSFIVNNFNGTSSGVVKKMYKVLDSLK